MPIRYEGRCKICKLSKIDKQLKRRIFESTYYNDNGLESLASIHRDYKSAFAYNRMLHHCKKHIVMTDKERESLNKKYQNSNEPTKALSNTEPNQPPTLQTSKPGMEDEVLSQVMDMGLQDLKDGKLQIRTGDLINAAKTKAELGLKRKDQELKIQEMIWHFASGENERQKAYDERIIEGETATTYDATAITAENARRREAWPRPIHQRDAGDAASRWAS